MRLMERLLAPRVLRVVVVRVLVRLDELGFPVLAVVVGIRVIVEAVVLREEVVERVHRSHVPLVPLVVDVVVAVDHAVGSDACDRGRRE